MNNDNKVETAIAGLNCWATYTTDDRVVHKPTQETKNIIARGSIYIYNN